MRKKMFVLVAALVAATLVVGCAAPATEPTVVVTATPTSMPAPDMDTQVATAVAATMQAVGLPAETPVEPTVEATEVATEEPTELPAEEDLDNEVFAKSYSLNLSEYFTEPVHFHGWAPIELSPNGEWFAEHTADYTWDSVSQTWKRAAEGCTLPGACNVYSPSGVLGADDYQEAEANPSAVWTGSMWHGSPDNSESEFGVLCPEGSYCDMYALQFGQVLIGPADEPYIELSIPSCGPECGQGLLIRNWLARPGVDLNTTVRIADYGEPGAASWTEYSVPPEAAEYFSQAYATAQAENAHLQHNNGSGPEDNTLFIQHVLDLNDMSYTVLGHTAERGWFLIWTNVVAYGDH